jgi:hypothetical protein
MNTNAAHMAGISAFKADMALSLACRVPDIRNQSKAAIQSAANWYFRSDFIVPFMPNSTNSKCRAIGFSFVRFPTGPPKKEAAAPGQGAAFDCGNA